MEYENGVLQFKRIDLATMIKSLRLTWPQRIFLVNDADNKFSFCINSELSKRTQILENLTGLKMNIKIKNYL